MQIRRGKAWEISPSVTSGRHTWGGGWGATVISNQSSKGPAEGLGRRLGQSHRQS